MLLACLRYTSQSIRGDLAKYDALRNKQPVPALMAAQ